MSGQSITQPSPSVKALYPDAPAGHGEQVLRFSEPAPHLRDCTLTCACGETFHASAATDFDAYQSALAALDGHYQTVRRARVDHYLKVSKRAKEPW